MIVQVIAWSLRNRFLVWLGTLAVLVAGIWAIRATPLDALPDLSDVQVVIQTDFSEQAPQIPSRQSDSKAIGSLPLSISPSLTTSSISRNDMSSRIFLASQVSRRPGVEAFFCRQILRVRFMTAMTNDQSRMANE